MTRQDSASEKQPLLPLERGDEILSGETKEDAPVIRAPVMERVLDRANLFAALKRVTQNKGSAGIDGMSLEELPSYLKAHWPRIRGELQEGSYKPQPVKRVSMPKFGGGERHLGIPPVLDRLIQQALLQVIQPEWDRSISHSSYGFRPGRSAHQAIAQAQSHIKAGYRLDLKQRKTKKYRNVTMNKTVIDAIDNWLKHHPRSLDDDAPLFIGQRGNQITVPYTNNLVKLWCQNVGLKGNYGSHTLRKTWGYQQRVQRNTPIPLLMEAFGHTTQKQTLEYLCIQADEISELFDMEL